MPRRPILRTAAALVLTVLMFATVPTAVAAGAVPEPGPVIDVQRNIQYGEDLGPLLLDVYRPRDRAGPLPGLLVIHGGGWVKGDKEDLAEESRAIAANGFVVFDVNYRLAGARPGFPSQVLDVTAAYRWVLEQGAAYGTDVTRIGAVGTSAGAYLAAMLGTTVNAARELPPLRAVVALSGPLDLRELVNALRQGVTCPPEAASCADRPQPGVRIETFLGCSLDDCDDDLVARASPVTHVTAESPPFFLANSLDESMPASQATGMANTLAQARVPAVLRLVPGAGHGVAYAKVIARELNTFLDTYVVNAQSLETPSPTATPSRRATPSPTASPALAEDPALDPRKSPSRALPTTLLVIVAVLVLAFVSMRRRS